MPVALRVRFRVTVRLRVRPLRVRVPARVEDPPDLPRDPVQANRHGKLISPLRRPLRIIGIANLNVAFESAKAVCSLSKPRLNRFLNSPPTPYSMRSSAVVPVLGIRLNKTCRESDERRMARELQLGSGPLANLSHSGTHRQQVEELWNLAIRLANFFEGSGNN